MIFPSNKKIYFASDHHFGAPDSRSSKLREASFLDWMNKIEPHASHLFLVGDLFDFWFEYEKVVPKGFIRVFGKIAHFVDLGIKVHYFIGNHDLWMKDYFEIEIGAKVHHNPCDFTFGQTTFFIGHGDGLGPNDIGYKRMKKVFTNPLAKRLFQGLHPDIGMRLGLYFSKQNKLLSGNQDTHFLGNDKEWLVQYAHSKLAQKHRDYFIFGHRHLPLEIDLTPTSKYINLGDWITHFTYAEFDGTRIDLKEWKSK
ncbi:MAG: UDP-2,3-diacylglucosamine diphosphatase [Flavobacteriaceae bacterium]